MKKKLLKRDQTHYVFKAMYALWTSDVVFVVDTSGSISTTQFSEVVGFLYNLTSYLTIGPSAFQVSVVTFNSTVTEEFALNENADLPSLLTSIGDLDRIVPDGGTFTFDALNYVESNSFDVSKGGRSTADHVVVVVTDGQSPNLLQTTAAADALRTQGIEVIAVGIGDTSSLSEAELNAIANDPDSENVFYISDFIYICNLIPALLEKLGKNVNMYF